MKWLLRLFASLLLILTGSLLVFAQSIATASLSGTVTDLSAVVPGANRQHRHNDHRTANHRTALYLARCVGFGLDLAWHDHAGSPAHLDDHRSCVGVRPALPPGTEV